MYNNMNADICAILSMYIMRPIIYRLLVATNANLYIYYNRILRKSECMKYLYYNLKLGFSQVELYNYNIKKYDNCEYLYYKYATLYRNNIQYSCNYNKYRNMPIIRDIKGYYINKYIHIYSKWLAYISQDDVLYEYNYKGLSAISAEYKIINIQFYNNSYCIYLYSDYNILTITKKCINIYYNSAANIYELSGMKYDKYVFNTGLFALYPNTNIPIYIIDTYGITVYYSNGKILCHILYNYDIETRTYTGKCGIARFFDKYNTRILKEYK